MIIEKCDSCLTRRATQYKEEYLTNVIPSMILESMSTDIFSLNRKSYLVCVNGLSGYAVIKEYRKDPNTDQTIETFSRWFRDYGYTKNLRMDQGCVYTYENSVIIKGTKNLYIIADGGIRARLNCLPGAANGDMVLATLKKGKSEFCKQVMSAVVIRPRKTFRRKDDSFLYFEDNAGVIVKNKGEIKGSAITGPVSKECADLWPIIASQAESIL
nr:60S ribosomal protein L23-like [Lepeophtheirus salmonis]